MQEGERVELRPSVEDSGMMEDGDIVCAAMASGRPITKSHRRVYPDPAACWHGKCWIVKVFQNRNYLIQNGYQHVRIAEPQSVRAVSL